MEKFNFSCTVQYEYDIDMDIVKEFKKDHPNADKYDFIDYILNEFYLSDLETDSDWDFHISDNFYKIPIDND